MANWSVVDIPGLTLTVITGPGHLKVEYWRLPSSFQLLTQWLRRIAIEELLYQGHRAWSFVSNVYTQGEERREDLRTWDRQQSSRLDRQPCKGYRSPSVRSWRWWKLLILIYARYRVCMRLNDYKWAESSNHTNMPICQDIRTCIVHKTSNALVTKSRLGCKEKFSIWPLESLERFKMTQCFFSWHTSYGKAQKY